MAMAKKTFEEALAGLEQITKDLENGNLSLEQSLKKFDEGIKLAEFCGKKLEDAQQKVEILQRKDGKLTASPFGDNLEKE
jgi:exodeoxyribonuclease VII small subunit